jgi:hypothetical protein
MPSVYRFPESPIKHSKKKPISFLVTPTNSNGTEYYLPVVFGILAVLYYIDILIDHDVL